MSYADRAISWTEQGLVPDVVIRSAIRRMCKQRLAEIHADDADAHGELVAKFIALMDSGPIAPLPEKANEQHYELPAGFFGEVLGKHRKYSSCFWREGTTSLDEAETAALAITCERAQLADSQHILELGCGWGSLSLWMAAHYPHARITAVSNSNSQREYINAQATQRGLRNLTVITCDMNSFDTADRFDRIVSVEMFEHMRNYRQLFARIKSWLRPGGKFFMHIFVHRAAPYEFVDQGASDWMSRYFFSGGMMPSADLPLFFQNDLQLKQRWHWNGQHYEKTANAWLKNLDDKREQVLPLLKETYCDANAEQWLQRWRIFFMACAELFGYARGQEWWVSHYLFERSL